MRDTVDLITDQWRRERPDLDPSPMGVVGRATRLAELLERGLSENFRRHGLTRWEFDVLATLRRSGGPLTVGRLGATMMITSGTLTNRLDRVAAKAWISREPAPNDRRGIVVRLTDAGRALVDEALVTHLETEKALLAGLDEDEREQLAGLMRKLLLQLGDKEP